MEISAVRCCLVQSTHILCMSRNVLTARVTVVVFFVFFLGGGVCFLHVSNYPDEKTETE